jgi:hypothetical protein
MNEFIRLTMESARQRKFYSSGVQFWMFNDLRPDRLLVNIGIWNVNNGASQIFASYFDYFNLKYGLNAESKIDGKLIKLKDDKLKWKMGKDILYPPTHVAGEHHYYVEVYNQLKY